MKIELTSTGAYLTKGLALLVGALLLLTSKVSDATSCYTCDSTDSCNDPFNTVTNARNIQTGCTYCAKSSITGYGGLITKRACQTGIPTIMNCVGGMTAYSCACDGWLCNGATSTPIYLPISFIAATFATVYVTFK